MDTSHINDTELEDTESEKDKNDERNVLEADRDSLLKNTIADNESNDMETESSTAGLESGIKCHVNLSEATTKCCITNCPSNLGNINCKTIYVTFPKDPSRFAEWTRAIKRPELNLNASTKRAQLLICSNHFPKSMWVNSNTRLKKLHKNAVPELVELQDNNKSGEDDLAVIDASHPIYRPGPKSSKSGLKIKKVSSLLAESALSDGSVRPKWNLSLQRKRAMASTTKEKRLLDENAQLKSELDTNMDYILNQKSHYESLLEKEKDKSTILSNKLNHLDVEREKAEKTFECQISQQRTRANKGEVCAKDSTDKLKKALTSSQNYEMKYTEAQSTITILREANDDLMTRINELADNSPPPPAENILQGENFKVFLNSYLKEHKALKKKIDIMTQDLKDRDTSDGQRSLLLSLASQHLNHGQFAWLQTQLLDMADFNDCPDHFKEFCISLYQVSEAAYRVCLKAFGLAPIWCVKSWINDPHVDSASVTSMINSLYEESMPLRKGLNFQLHVMNEKNISDMVEQNGVTAIKIRSIGRGTKKRKVADDSDSEDDEERDEGMLSDEDEELSYSTESDEEIITPKIPSQGTNGRAENNYFQPSKAPPSAGPSQTSVQPDFDFMLEESSQHHLGTSMPILGPSSPMVGLAGMNHNRKKILPDGSVPSTSGSKVIYRVVGS